jgi:hypothetical protein
MVSGCRNVRSCSYNVWITGPYCKRIMNFVFEKSGLMKTKKEVIEKRRMNLGIFIFKI